MSQKLRPAEVAAEYGEYGLTETWLTRQRKKRQGPPFLKISYKVVVYDRNEIEAWLASRRVQVAA